MINATMDDHALLREYLEQQSETAFSELVRRHLPLVYGTALRLRGDASAAQDVAQTVFIQLARQAWSIREGRALPGWLYRATRHAAFAARRAEIRRRQRESEAMKLADQNQPSVDTWELIAPLLDEAISRLSRVEQDAVVLRFFQDRGYREVGAMLGLKEEAARKRTERSLEKIRAHFARRGVTTTTALLGSTLAAHAAVPPPIGLAERVSHPPINAVASGGLGFVIREIFIMNTKTKIVIAAAIVVILAAFFWNRRNGQDASTNRQVASPPVSQPSPSLPVATVPTAVKGGILPPKLTPAQIAAFNQPVAESGSAPVPFTPDRATRRNSAPPVAAPTQQELRSITTNLRLLANAARVYMAQNNTTEANYSDLVGDSTESYMGSGKVTPVMGEDYTGIEIKKGDSQVTISTPDGTNIIYNL